MKNLLFLLLLIPFIGKGQINVNPAGSVYNNISDLRKQIARDSSIVYVAGGSNVTDFRGSFYRYLSSSQLAEDNVYFNVVKPNNVTVGRWIRLNQTTIPYPQGTLFRIGMLKIFAASGVTDSNGEVTINLTSENTSGGTSIFNSIFFNSGTATVNATTPNDVVSGSVKSLSGNLKTCTYRFSKGSLSVLGIATLAAAGANTPISVIIVGI